VLLTNLAQHYALKNTLGFSATLDWAFRITAVLVLPAAMGLLVFSGPLLTTLFNYGAFDSHDTLMVTWALTTYSMGLLSFTMVKVLLPAYYARQDSKSPFRYAVVAVAANLFFNLIITIPWVRAGWIAPHAGLALSTSLASFVNAAQLYHGLRKAGAYTPTGGWQKLLIRVLVANAVMGGMLLIFSGHLADWEARTALYRMLWLAGWLAAAFAAYFGTLFATGFRINDLRVKGTQLPSGATPV
jgi:putative peptidoglycan lipid II flippase